MSFRPLFLTMLLVLSCMGAAFADDKEDKSEKKDKEPAVNATAASPPAQTPAAPSPNLVELVQRKDYRAVWGTMFKSEYSPPEWVSKLDAHSTSLSEATAADGKTYWIGSMCNINDCASDRFMVAFSGDRKKAWGLGISIPAGLGKEGIAHPKKYAALRWYAQPDQTIRKVLMTHLEKDPNWK